MHDDDGVLGQDGEVDDLDTQQLGEDAGADVGDVGGAEAEHLIVHGEEHVLEHGGSVHQGLLGASAAIDGAVDRVSHARILGEDDVTGHDLGLVLTHSDLHVVGLGLGLLAEEGQSSLVALLLGGGVGHLAGLEGQVGIDGHHDGTDADALRSVNSLVHYVSSLLFPIRAHGEQKHSAHVSRGRLPIYTYEIRCLPSRQGSRANYSPRPLLMSSMAAARASFSSAPSHLTSTSVPQGMPAAMRAIGDLPLTSLSGATTVTSEANLPMVEAKRPAGRMWRPAG